MRHAAFCAAMSVMLMFSLLIFVSPSGVSPPQAPPPPQAVAESTSHKPINSPVANSEASVELPRAATSTRDTVPWGAWLQHTQTAEQRAVMLNACPSERRIRVDKSENFDQFMEKAFGALAYAVVGKRPIMFLLENFDAMWERHGGLTKGFWTEFGVFRGHTLAAASDALLNGSKLFGGVVAGFDSFQGLPVEWRPGFGAAHFGNERFDIYNFVRNRVHPKVELYKGWFQNTINQFLQRHPRMPAAFIHHDGDLFVSTAIAFSMLSKRIVPGTFLTFDELVGYHGYEQHEILSLYLWMMEYDAELCAIAVHSKIEGEIRYPKPPAGKRKNRPVDSHADLQSAVFQVLSMSAPTMSSGLI